VVGAKVQLVIPQVQTIASNGTITKITPNVDPSLLNFQVNTSTFLTPNGGTSNVSFELVSLALIQQLTSGVTVTAGSRFDAQIEANIKMFGYEGGSNIDADPFTYGVDLCSDCVLQVIGACPVPTSSVPASTPNPCNPAQDGALACCANAQGGLTCPPTTM
jgi:hypothetical protein